MSGLPVRPVPANSWSTSPSVSLLLDLGVPPHIVRDIVGHSDIEVTMTIYAHAALDEKRKALRKL